MELFGHSLVVFVVAFAVTFCMVPVSKRIAVRIGAIDYPGNRRVNTEPIPRCGGIALFAGFVAALIVVYIQAQIYDSSMLDFVMERSVNSLLLLLGITLMFVVGLIDDITQLSAPVKFGGQIIACCVVVASGVSIMAVVAPFTETHVMLYWLDFPLTVLYLLVFVNITNLIDGLDGLAAGLVAIASACLFVLVAARGGFILPAMCMALIGCCLAFLRFNFYPASVFMGDSGALFLGLAVGVISTMGVVRTQSLVLMLVPLVIAGVPVIDTTSAIIRRLRGHVRIDQADMGHVHHRLMHAGFDQKKSVLILYACSAVLGAAGVAVGQLSGAGRWIVLAVLAVVVAVVIWKFKLFSPVLAHYYAGQGKTGPRQPQEPSDM